MLADVDGLATDSAAIGSSAEPTRIIAVVVTRNRKATVERTIDALHRQERPLDRICVVDNASDDGTVEWIRATWPAVDVVELADNTGYSGGLAVGMARHVDDCDALLLLDDDSPPPPDLVRTLARCLATNPQVGVVGTSGALMRWGNPRGGRWRWARSLEGHELRGVDACLVDNALVRTAAVRAAGTTDPTLFMVYEDLEFTLRVRRAGYQIAVVAGLKVERLHLGSTNPWRAYYLTRNQLLVALDLHSAKLVAGWLWRTAKLVVAGLALRRSAEWPVVRYRMKGAVDGFRRRRGMTVDPSKSS